MYDYLIYPKPGFSKNMEEIKSEMEHYFEKSKSPKPVFRVENERLLISFDDYYFRIDRNDEPYVAEELAEILADGHQDDFAGNPINKNEIAQSKYRFELSGDDDVEMDYFNESLFIIEFFEENGNYVIIDCS